MMKRLALLTTVFLTALLSCTSGAEERCRLEVTDAPQKEKIASIAQKQDHRDKAAVLSNTRTIYRLCNTRPQRLLPTYGSNSGKTAGKHGFYSYDRRFNPFKLLHDGRQRQETAPFCSSASSDYYVIALRRIIR